MQQNSLLVLLNSLASSFRTILIPVVWTNRTSTFYWIFTWIKL